MRPTWDSHSTLDKNLPLPLGLTHPTWTGLGLNTGLYGEGLVTDHMGFYVAQSGNSLLIFQDHLQGSISVAVVLDCLMLEDGTDWLF
jgi:hypothetical protein